MSDSWENKNESKDTCPNCGRRVHGLNQGTKCGHCCYDFKTKSAPITGKPIKPPGST